MNGLKEFFTYITNQLKFWVIIKDWEHGLKLRNGKIKKELPSGIYFKIPFLDFFYSQPNRTLDIYVSQINCLSKDKKNITISASVFYKITSIKDYYLGYAEPNAMISQILKNKLSKYISFTNTDDLEIGDIEKALTNEFRELKNKGMEFSDVKILTISNARTYRIIKDNLYSQPRTI